MFLRDISIKNFKCHSDLYLSFETEPDPDEGLEIDVDTDANWPIRKTTFLLGENGTGKSALLKAVALVTAGSTALSHLLGDTAEWVTNGKKTCELRATLTTAEGEDREIRLRIDRGAQLVEILEKNRSSLELIDRAIAHADRNYFVVAYGASRRLNRDSQFFTEKSPLSFPRSANVFSLFNPDAQLVSLANWAMELDYTGKGDGLKTVKRALDSFLVEHVSFRRIDRERKQLIFATPDGELPLSQLSDGYQNVASWVGDLMYRINETFRDFKDPLKARGLLLIDEIDLHLHPRWQRLLHAFLTNKLPNFQIVATTHSPLTAQQAAKGELYALRREAKKVGLTPFRGAPNKMLLHQILMSPVFGLESDESLEMEQERSQIREQTLKSRTRTNAKSQVLKGTPAGEGLPLNVRTNGLLSEDDVNLLKTINDELKLKK